MQIGVRARVLGAVALVALVAVVAVAVTHDSHSRAQRQAAAPGTAANAPRHLATPPRANDLRGVLGDWTANSPHGPAVVGVQVGTRAPVFSASRSLSDTTRFGVVVPDTKESPTTPAALMAYVDDVLRAHAHGVSNLTTSYFRIGRDGRGRGVEGFTTDGFCAHSAGGCAKGTTFFAVGLVGVGAGGTAAVVYDPSADVGIVALSRTRSADLTDLVERALLLTTLGRAGYERAVSSTAHPAPSAPAA